MVLESSTVMTPSLPTLSIASAMRSPICSSAAEIDAVCAICSRVSTSVAEASSSSETAWTAFSMPRLSAIASALAAEVAQALAHHRLGEDGRRRAVTGDVVGLLGDFLDEPRRRSSRTGPRFDLLGDADTVVGDRGGAPLLLEHDARPFGPSVTLTASARTFIPCPRPRRASSSNAMILAIRVVPPTRIDVRSAGARVTDGLGLHAHVPCASGSLSGRAVTLLVVKSANAIIGTRRGECKRGAAPIVSRVTTSATGVSEALLPHLRRARPHRPPVCG